jgi:hypothetical protein
VEDDEQPTLLDKIIGDGGSTGKLGWYRWRFWLVVLLIIIVAGLITGKI